MAIADYPIWDHLILSQKLRIGIEQEQAIHFWVSLALNMETWNVCGGQKSL